MVPRAGSATALPRQRAAICDRAAVEQRFHFNAGPTVIDTPVLTRREIREVSRAV
jgi:hypothetical protein